MIYHETPALDAYAKDIARLKAGCQLLEEIYFLMHTGLFPDARPPLVQEVHARDLTTAIKKALQASKEDFEEEAVPEMCKILEAAITIKKIKLPPHEENEREKARLLVSKMRDHFGHNEDGY